ncbi:NAD-dependent epimerase/dehydratase family protein [Bacillus pseudomycoides]|uniref:NAD-dependent epimerase/dehydratase family protein n=1 Tax=Bacillus pseudomycoides TaxID=64104 RepID=UPI000BEBF9FA|nr:NAD(P)-dependent oxidoreductase [Bacillus pseudomycoides]PEE40427.1 3-beta hydroxysteroid dehydrogenase [Bacillus pseudomycoides]PEI85983.1 3-beta hydroxysteroid dehydrogenase [Bacillus pseudomycoides]PGA93665.1 3-beta hydroxysteroid dehydrogenase [Bacillus pseudomycoides]PHF51758.1 3-beta hydroxysteroid dehydrogenase [Bacillus pseudomycoides]
MKTLVTGGTGFLGQKLAFRLASMGYEVTATGRNKAIGKLLERNGIEFVYCPLEDRHSVLQVCKDKDYIFHSGALSSPWGKYKDFYNANVLGTKHIIEGSQKSGIKRLIHVSTPSIYFYYDERQDVVENAKLPDTFVNHYAKTKYLAEQSIDQAFNHGLPVITIRPRALFGPGDNAILPRLIKVCEKGALPRIGTEDVLVDITYIDNVVDALLLCMHSPKHTLGQKYNITNGERVNLYEVIENVMKRLGKEVQYKKISYKAAFTIAAILEGISKTILFGKEPILTKYTVSVLSKSQTLSIDKAQKELGYAPNISIEEGITKFVEWWKTQ